VNVIYVVAALITDPAGRMLTVRKRDTQMFMNPGGKPEVGESAVQALCRELAEEVGLEVSAQDLTFIDTYTVKAANEPGFDVCAEVFRLGPDVGEHTIGAEIVESRWIDPHVPGNTPLAALAADHMLPILVMSDPSATRKRLN
jgi:8-oxo-dGTP pyrophosphatase MutT (NUDIX family)